MFHQKRTRNSICCGRGPAATPGPTTKTVVGPGRAAGPRPQPRMAACTPKRVIAREHTSAVIPHSRHPYTQHPTRHSYHIQITFTLPRDTHRDVQTSFTTTIPHSYNSTSILVCRARGGGNSRRRGRQTAATTLTKDTNEKQMKSKNRGFVEHLGPKTSRH